MSIIETKEKMKTIQSVLLEFLEDESNAEENSENFFKLVSEYHQTEDKYKFKSILRLINAIANNHQRVPNFIFKVERILGQMKQDLQNYFSNSEIFEIFKDNKRILLFLIEEKLITIDKYIFSLITSYEFQSKNYAEYFFPEIKPFLTKENIEKYQNENPKLREISEEFYEKRKEGENDSYLCELIRKNQVKEFGVYVNRNNISLESYIEKSIFETNQLLLENINNKMIEYASFYGSIDIIRYMRFNGNVELTSNMWNYAVHSCNAELIRYLEDNHVSPIMNNYERILEESIKCHHNEVSKYIIDYLIKEEDLQDDIENNYIDNFYMYAVEFHNYCFFPTNMHYKCMFLCLCEFDYYTLVKLYLSEGNIDVNAAIRH